MSNKICLLMIVKDEEPIITRALCSMKNIISSYYIMDTGSTDNTVNIIRNWMSENNIDGCVEITEWKNFGYNKSLLFKNAREHQNKNISGADYYCWLDADEVWIKDPNDPLSYLTIEDTKLLKTELSSQYFNKNIFYITTYYESLQYKRWNIVRNNQLYIWKQPVHEYLVGTEDESSANLLWFCLLARKEGNSSRNSNRYKKDIELFLEFLKENPNDSRAIFYLAQSYKDSGNIEKAIEYYKKRVDIEIGFDQEKYISCLKLGSLLKNKYEKIQYYSRGIEIDRSRLECYYYWFMIYYNEKSWNLAYAIGSLAPQNRNINTEFLFVEKNIYQELFDINFSVACYYTQKYQEGIDACSRVLTTSCNESMRNLSLNNLKFFIPKVENKLENKSVFKEPPKQDVIIIENFYDNPDEIREMVLKENFNVKGNYPGQRTKSIMIGNMKEKFESIIGRKITYWPDEYNGSFQYVLENDKSWIHRDKTDWSAIVFLTPNAPTNGGTKTFIHKESGLTYANTNEEEIYLNQSANNEGDWYLLDKLGNIYNRCIMFRGRKSHISDKYFGTELKNARLFQTFFFNDS